MTTLTLDHLVGTHVRLWPYVRGLYSRDVLYRLWRVVEEAKAGPNLFWASLEPVEQQSDLSFFVHYFETPNRILLILTNPDASEIAGCIWFDDVVPKYRCFGSIFLHPKFRGDGSREAVRLGLTYAFEVLEVKSVWGATPWPAARRLCLKVGFEVVAVLPRFARINEQPTDVSIVRITKETFDGIHIP